MIARIGTLTLIALLSAPLFGCDKPGEKEQDAEGRANMQAQEARNQADQTIAQARVDFQKSRDAYRTSRQSDLADLNKKLADLDAKDRIATGQTKADLDAKLPAVEAQRDAYVADMKSLDSASAATWDDTKLRLDNEWSALKANVDKL